MERLIGLLVLAGVGYLLGTVFVRWPSIWRNIRYHGSESWTQVQATVESHATEPYYSRGGVRYRPCLSYSYSFQGEYFGGTYNGNLYPSEDDTQSFLDQHPINSALAIRVNPKNPAKSVLFLPE